jgi:hypothetical protein
MWQEKEKQTSEFHKQNIGRGINTMANATLARPVVTMNLANRSIGRFGLATNRVLHPLVVGRFGREVGMLAQMSDVKVIPSQTGITARTEFNYKGQQ